MWFEDIIFDFVVESRSGDNDVIDVDGLVSRGGFGGNVVKGGCIEEASWRMWSELDGEVTDVANVGSENLEIQHIVICLDICKVIVVKASEKFWRVGENLNL